MAIDQPIVVYPKDKSKQKNNGHTAEEMNAMADNYARKHKSRVGKHISLGDYLGQDIKEHIKG
ncbi:hypothetical protein [Bacteroides pyogenes]|uniref:hypothetical protein n=1 Tax=Bacteroides pyogenes TaxID=310300 RepID=UPI002FDB0517